MNLRPFVRGGEPLELAQGLPSQVAAVHEEQHSPCPGVLDQAVCLVAGHEGLAASGGHLHQRPRPPRGQGLLQVPDGPLLHRPQARRVQRRHGLQSLAQVVSRQVVTRCFTYPLWSSTQRFGGADPRGECSRGMEGEDQTASRLRVQPVGELRLRAGTLVQEWERALVGGKVLRQACAVLLRLDLHAGKGGTFWLGLDDAHRLLVDVEQVVGGAMAGLQRKLAHSYSAAGVQVDGVGVLNRPSCLLKQPVYVYAGLLFGSHAPPTDDPSQPTIQQSLAEEVKSMSRIGYHRAHGFGQPCRHHGAGGRQLFQVSG